MMRPRLRPAIDVDTRELLTICVSWQRNILYAETFLRRVLEACTNKPLILVDKGPWYSEAFQVLGLEWARRTFGEKPHRTLVQDHED